VTIHGTHERRSKYLVNPLESLEHAGILIHLSASTAVFDIEGKKVAIHGMSGVPDKFAGESFNEWNPKPVPEALNIMMLHNSISPYIYSPTEPPTMSIDDLPKGFDFYILGHMHWNEVRPLHEGRLLLCGSTIPTATRKSESEQLKCIFKYDGELRKIPLDFQRKIIWKEYDFDASTKDSIRNFIETISVDGPKPVINIKVKGVSKSLPSNFGDIEDKFAKKAIVNINKETENLKEQIER
jgi:DNA repair exonuclease SbcCD nuclease subunit